MKFSTVASAVGLTLVASIMLVAANTFPPKECSYSGLKPLYEECLKSGAKGSNERVNCIETKLNPKAEDCVDKQGDSKDDFHVGLANAVDFLHRPEYRVEAVMDFMTNWSFFN